MIDTMIARQPIFDRHLNVVAYELLYRGQNLEKAEVDDGNKATADVFMTALVITGVDKLSEGKRVFVNFTEKLIMDDVPSMMSPKHLAIEILEDIEFTDMLLEACQSLKDRGYILALDDFILGKADEKIAKIVDIIKVDFIHNSKQERSKIFEKYSRDDVEFLAEKIETPEEFQEALDMGYSFFQGYFFSKPSIIKGKDIVPFPDTYINILNELQTDEPEYSKLAKVIEADIGISYKLLRLINSPAFYTSKKIESIQHALVLLGFKEIQKWIALLLLRDVSKDKPDEILKISLIRAKMGENLAKIFGFGARKSSVFLMGMFSMADVLTGQDMLSALNELPLEEDVKEALLGGNNSLSIILDFIFLYEKGDWDNMLISAKKYKIPTYAVSDAYMDGVEWVAKTLEI